MTLNGVIIRGVGGFYYVNTQNGVFECKARGIFRKDGITPAVGDKCVIAVKDEERLLGNLEEILPRKNCLIRPPVANIDTLSVVCAATQPEPDTLFIDKLFVIAEKNNIRPILVINKTDLAEGIENQKRLIKTYTLAGYTVLQTCGVTGKGTDKLKSVLIGGISAFAGASGVGKSSLLNFIMPFASMETGDLSNKTQRGKHTTRHSELHSHDGLLLMDTPGFGSLELTGITAAELEGLFVEFAPYISDCRFRGCRHINEPECAVKSAVENGKIAQSRYFSYTEFYNLLKDIKEWET